jgi:hypothetical protein
MILRQSTAVDVLIGPFVDSTDAYTAETGVSPAVKLSKNGQTLGAKNDATTPVHDADGYYNCELDATDTNTVGTLMLTVTGSSTSLPVRHTYQVIEEAVYDELYAGSAAGPLNTTTIAEPSQGKPSASPTAQEILNRLYRRHIYAKVVIDTNSANQVQIFADDGSTILWEHDITDSSNVTTVAEAQSGA